MPACQLQSIFRGGHVEYENKWTLKDEPLSMLTLFSYENLAPTLTVNKTSYSVTDTVILYAK